MRRVVVENISKDFKIGFRKNQTMLGRAVSGLSGKTPKKKIRVLDDISFCINSGEIVGLIGNNGSGKSTLLRIISGIYPNYEGRVLIDGKVTALIGLMSGLNERLTLIENAFVAGSLFGMCRKEIQQKLPTIVKFAELEEFQNTQLYQFSSGMKSRFVISLALHTNPDIFLADEVFAVGDLRFREKCQKKIKELVDNGMCVLLASHSLTVLEKNSERIIWLDKGKIKKEGTVKEILEEYGK